MTWAILGTCLLRASRRCHRGGVPELASWGERRRKPLASVVDSAALRAGRSRVRRALSSRSTPSRASV